MSEILLTAATTTLAPAIPATSAPATLAYWRKLLRVSALSPGGVDLQNALERSGIMSPLWHTARRDRNARAGDGHCLLANLASESRVKLYRASAVCPFTDIPPQEWAGSGNADAMRCLLSKYCHTPLRAHA